MIRALAVLLWALAGLQAMAAPALTTTTLLTEAEVSHNDGATWLTVPLPDSWARRGPQDRAAAAYRLQLDLTEAPTQPMAMSFDRLSSHHRVSLNGQVLSQRGDGPGFVNRRAPTPTLIDLPPGLLRAGRNELLIEVQYAGKGSLSAPLFGPTGPVWRAHALNELLQVDVPQSLNLASLGLALFMLTVWLRRPSELALGYFGAASLVVSLRNLAYLAAIDLAPPGLLDWFFYTSQVASAVLLGLFVRALTGRGGRVYLRLLLVLAVVLPLWAAACAALDHANPAERLALGNAATRLGQLRRWTYPLLFVATLPALAWTWSLARRQPRRSIVLLSLGLGALMLAGLHDYAVQIGRAGFTSQYLLPFVFPMVMGAMSVFLVARMVAATGAAEALARELDERVALRTQQLSQANAAKARFLSAASHDLRQPVMTIGLLASLLREQQADPATTQRLVTRLQGAAQAMSALLNGLMDMSRLDPLLVEPRQQAVPLQKVFDAIAQHAQDEADRKGLRLRFRPTACVVRADPVLLEQLLRNLVSNALRYTSAGGVLVAARAPAAGRVRVEVWDTGIGIAPQDQARVFEEFVQLGNPGRDQRLGLGIGLAIAQRGAAAMGTQVALRSRPGRGSCFSVTLPVSTRAAEAHAPAPAAAAALPLRGFVLWVLDNDDGLREALVLRLQAWGAKVQALSSLAALQVCIEGLAGTAAPALHLLLTDQRLGDGCGSDAIEWLRTTVGRSVRCMLLTGDAASAPAQALAAQGVPVLAKPVSDEALLAAIEQALAKQAGA